MRKITDNRLSKIERAAGDGDDGPLIVQLWRDGDDEPFDTIIIDNPNPILLRAAKRQATIGKGIVMTWGDD
jgi:hypothetical protein